MSSQPPRLRPRSDDLAGDVEAVLTASRALIGIAAGSLATLDGRLSAPQWRALVVIAQRGRASGQEVAQALGVHASTATRVCDRLVSEGLVERRDDPDDRRFLALTPSTGGRRLVAEVTARRRADLAVVLARLEPDERTALAKALTAFSHAAGEVTVDPTWDLRAEPSV